MSEEIKVVYRNVTQNEDLGVLGFEKVVGKIGDEYTDLQSIADVTYNMANNIQCPIYYGKDEPDEEHTKGFWLDTSSLEE